MLRIDNVKVYELAESIIAAGYAMGKSLDEFEGRTEGFNKYVFYNGNTDFIKGLITSLSDGETVNKYLINSGITDDAEKVSAILAAKDLNRIIKLVSASGNSTKVKCHHNAITGIRVSFDIIYPNYISPEMQRYHFFDIVTSSSKMHRLTSFNLDTCFNKYVTEESKENMRKYIDEYNTLKHQIIPDDMYYSAMQDEKIYKAFMKVLSNCPQGIELFMRVSTNYMELQTMYNQRKNHRLKEDWGAFCKFVETLPLSKELIIGNFN